MAAQFTKQSATPYSISYLIAGDDGSAATLAAATLLADTVAGPLQREIASLPGQLNTLNSGAANHGRVRIRFVTGVESTNVIPRNTIIQWVAAGLSAQLTAASAVAIEIRLIHGSEK